MINKINLAEIRRRLNNATPAPWRVEYGAHGKVQNTRIISDNHILTFGTKEIHSLANHIATIWNVTCTCIQGHQYDNQEFIAHSVEDISALLDLVSEQRKRIAELEKESRAQLIGRKDDE